MAGQNNASEALAIGTVVTTEMRRQYKIVKQLSEGGQGITYVVEGPAGKKCFKQYKRNMLKVRPDILSHIKDLIKKGAPDQRYYVWPQEAVSAGGLQGYIMEFVEKPFTMLERFVLPIDRKGVRFSSMKIAVDAMLNMVSAFNVLHMTGYSYQDLSLGNFMFHPETGDLRIIDNDNVSVNGECSGILGTPGFIAPEVLQNGQPNRHSDYYSLSIILFHILFRAHPLEGVRVLAALETPEMLNAMYCTDPVFMFDKDDARNRPSNQLQHYIISAWEQMPSYLQGAFLTAFSKETMLQKPNKRLDESTWEKVLIRLRNDILTCPNCDVEMVYTGRMRPACDACRQPLGPQLAFRTQKWKYPIPISFGGALMSANLRYCDTGKGNIKEIQVRRSSKDHRILVLQNVSGKRITVHRTTGQDDNLADSGLIAAAAVKQIVMSDGTVVTLEQLP